MPTRALQEPAEKMLGFVTHFDALLRLWKDRLPLQLRPAELLKHFTMPNSLRMLGLMTIQCSYYDLLMVIHRIFMYPWVVASFSNIEDTELISEIKEQSTKSSQVVANAARSLIVIMRGLYFDRSGTQS